MAISLSLQLMTISVIILNKEFKHNLIAIRSQWNDCYDYIVVGAGSAGAVVANRLSENPNIKVLLLEAGRPQSIVTDIPAIWANTLKSELDWNYTTVPQKNYGLISSGIIDMSRGKVIGGTSAINSMTYNRGNRRGFDDWVQTYGAIGWSYSEVLPYFIKSERNTDLNIVRQNLGYHGTRGPVGISSDRNAPLILKYAMKAFNELGFKTIDLNGAKQLGTAISQQYVDSTGMRSSTGSAYIDPNPHPNNLHILTDAFVVEILTEKLTAIGVQFWKNNKLYEVKADKEVVLSAGAINSPQILMLSGIGPKDHLRKLNIRVKADLPVGVHLKDHPSIPIYKAIIRDSLIDTEHREPELNIEQLTELFTNGSGPLSLRETAVLTYYSTRANRVKEWPNTVLDCLMERINTEFISQFKTRTTEWIDYFSPYFNKSMLTISAQLLKIRSTGTVMLRSNNPFDKPLIDPKYLTDPQDMEAMVEAIKFVFYYLSRTSISKYVYPIPGPIPGCQFCSSGHIYECDSYIKCLIRQVNGNLCHPVGTCRMGSVDRSDVVVDPSLKVLGLSALRVCDASVMPDIPNANTNAATILIGEKCSHVIKSDYRYRKQKINP